MFNIKKIFLVLVTCCLSFNAIANVSITLHDENTYKQADWRREYYRDDDPILIYKLLYKKTTCFLSVSHRQAEYLYSGKSLTKRLQADMRNHGCSVHNQMMGPKMFKEFTFQTPAGKKCSIKNVAFDHPIHLIINVDENKNCTIIDE